MYIEGPMISAIPHLSTTGWMKNPELIITKLYEHFLIADYSQSNTYIGQIASLKYILQNYDGVEDIKVAIQKTLYKQYINYYDQVDVDIIITERDDSTTYTVDITAILDDKTYTLSKMLTTDPNNNVSNMDNLLATIHE